MTPGKARAIGVDLLFEHSTLEPLEVEAWWREDRSVSEDLLESPEDLTVEYLYRKAHSVEPAPTGTIPVNLISGTGASLARSSWISTTFWQELWEAERCDLFVRIPGARSFTQTLDLKVAIEAIHPTLSRV